MRIIIELIFAKLLKFTRTNLLFLIVSFPICLFGQNNSDSSSVSDTSAWDYGIIGNMGLSQSYYEFWTAGGENSLAINSLTNTFVNYSTDYFEWENSLDLAYGLSFQDYNNTGKIVSRKTDDRIGLSSKIGLKTTKGGKVFYTGLLNFKTQFTKGYNYKDGNKEFVSDFFSPAYTNISLGIDYKPVKSLSFYASPVSGKFTFVLSDSLSSIGAYGVEVGDKVKKEFGGYFKAKYKSEIMKNVNLSTRLELFSNYLENPEAVDVEWEVLLILKVNKYLSASVNTLLIYDEDIDAINSGDGIINPRAQFKEIFGVGLSFSF